MCHMRVYRARPKPRPSQELGKRKRLLLSLVAAIACLPSPGETNLIPLPVIRRVVAAQDGLAEDECLWAQWRSHIDRQERGPTETPRLAVALALSKHRRRHPIVLRIQAQGEGTEVEDQSRTFGVAALRRTIEHRASQGQVKACRNLPRYAQEGSAGVQDGPATAIGAHADRLVPDAHAPQLNLPIAHVRGGHRGPSERRQDPLLIVTPKGDLAGVEVAPCEIDPEVGLPPVVAEAIQLAHEAEVAVQGQCLQAEAHHAIEGEVLEGVARHVRGRDDTELDATLAQW
mmetsp:Transcript_35210/g.75017  ORF Transcript_35210/g.75017 Transcript_35210/m.75017 type:complete len:287 (-) Transcript_35210:636-1496(-)